MTVPTTVAVGLGCGSGVGPGEDGDTLGKAEAVGEAWLGDAVLARFCVGVGPGDGRWDPRPASTHPPATAPATTTTAAATSAAVRSGRRGRSGSCGPSAGGWPGFEPA